MALTQINKAGLDELALDHVFTIGASGSSAYTFQGEGLNGTVNNPTLYLTRGKTYRFENGSGGHPIRIQSTSGASGTAYNTGVTNNAGSGTVIVEVQHDAPDILYYQCTSHAAMNGILYITGALADGGVTTAKIANDAVTDAKIAAGAVGTGAIATGAVTTSKIAVANVSTDRLADNAVTHAKYQDIPTSRILGRTSSGTGDVETLDDSTVRAFLGVSAGANQTTVNNNANNRVITGSGTANTLNGEAALTFDGSTLTVNGGSTDTPLLLDTSNSSGSHLRFRKDGANKHFLGSGGGFGLGDVDDLSLRTTDNIIFGVGNSEKVRINSSGTLNVGSTGYAGAGADPILYLRSTSGRQVKIHSTASGTCGMQLSNNTTGEGEDAGFHLAVLGTGDGYINNPHAKNIRFATTGTERLRILAGGGLTFNGDTASANALDDYEEGTWSPVLQNSSGSITRATYQAAYYVKVGRIVHLYGRMDCTAMATHLGGNTIHVGGFPFNSGNQGNSGDHLISVWGGSYNYWDNGYPSISIENNASRHGLYIHRTPGSSGQGVYALPTGNDLGNGTIQLSFNLCMVVN